MKEYKGVLFICSVLIVLGCDCFAQLGGSLIPLSPENKIRYQAVVESDSSRSREKTYEALRSWCVTTFVNSNQAVQIDNPESGTIIGKGTMELIVRGPLASCTDRWRFEFKLEAKDGRYRYTFESFTFASMNQGTKAWDGRPAEWFHFNPIKHKGTITMYADMLAQLDRTIGNLILSLNASMNSSAKEEDW
jgi:hypothetical protein